MNLLDVANNLTEKEGIFFSKNQREIFYPEIGNANSLQAEENSFWFNHRNQCIINSVKIHCKNSLFFDIGGGNGFVAKALEDNEISTVLVEPGVQGCINAKARGVKNIICSSLEDAGIIKNSLPAVGLFDVVEHIENDALFLGSVFEIVKPGGYVFINVPAFNTLWSTDDDYAGHFRRYTLSEMEKKLMYAGFTIKYSTYIFSILMVPVFLFRSIPSRLGHKPDAGDLNKIKNDHKVRKGLLNKILNRIWKYELNQIAKQKKIPFGGSCFVIAKKL